MLRLNNISYILKDFKLQDITFSVNDHEYFVIMGPSGAGKTVLLEIILGIRRQHSGEIFLDGKDISTLPPEKRGFSYVPQDYGLFPHMTVYENIAFGLKLRGFSKDVIDRKVRWIAERTEILNLLTRRPYTLSGGEKQRVALARALIIEPKIILLDEPLSSLDNRIRSEIKKFIKKLHKELKFTAIHVTHNFFDAAELADRMVLIVNGRLLKEGFFIDVIRDPNVAKYFEIFSEINILKGSVSKEYKGVLSIETDIGRIITSLPYRSIDFKECLVSIRPEDIVVSKQRIINTSIRNVVKCKVDGIVDKGTIIIIIMKCRGGVLKAVITRGAFEDLELRKGSKVYAAFKASTVHVIPR